MINTNSRIGFIGGGNMAEAIIKGITSQGIKDITVSEPAEERREYLGRNFGVNAIESNRELASLCNIIILAVKPQNIDTVVNEIGEAITKKKTVVSIAAGITLQYLTSKLKTKKLVRVMPNTPALVQEGMTVMAMCECFTDRDITIVREIFMSVGKVIVLPENIAFFVEAMAEGGIRMGLKNDDALTLAVQTMIGTSKLLGAGMSPSKVREMVTSPGGTTAAGLKAFDEKGFKDTVITAVAAAKNRAEELGRTG
jgi:pyrroline-5-carboxylate reductase